MLKNILSIGNFLVSIFKRVINIERQKKDEKTEEELANLLNSPLDNDKLHNDK